MPKKLDNPPTPEALAAMLQTMSGKQCAKALGMPKTTLLRYMRKYGLKAAPEVIEARQAYAVSLNAERFRSMGGLQKGEANPYWRGGVKASRQRWKAANRGKMLEKKRARYAVRAAILKGRLVKGPCEVCQTTNVQAHHDDYNEKLTVRWLCSKHHAEHHMNERRAAKGH